MDDDTIQGTVGEGRPRLAGWAPGTGVLVGGWVVGAAIARLTGAPAVILVLGATLVAFVADALAGFVRLRRVAVPELVVPRMMTTGDVERIDVRLPVIAGRPRGMRLTLRDLPRRGGNEIGRVDVPSALDPGSISVDAAFGRPGRLPALRVEVVGGGPASLVRWRRSFVVGGLESWVAPRASAPSVDVHRHLDHRSVVSGAPRLGDHRRGLSGDIDGVRQWRPGEDVGSIHWASSLRADELIVHDRQPAAAERWSIDVAALDPDDPDVLAGRIRSTIDEELCGGHRVTVVGLDGTERDATTTDDAAVLAAMIADELHAAAVAAPRSTRPWASFGDALRRPRRLVVDEPRTLDAVARYAAAGAAIISLGLLVGALDSPPIVLPLVAAAILAGAVVSLSVARHDGQRPLWLKLAVAAALLVAFGVIIADATTVDSVLTALRGPMPNVLMLLVALHGFEVLDRRTLRVHVAITLVVTTYAAGLRIDAALGWLLAAWGVGVAVALCRADRVPAAAVDRRRPPVAPSLSPAMLLRAGAWMLVCAAVTVAVLSVVPVPDGPARLGLPALSQGATEAPVPGSLVGADGTPSASSGDPSDVAERAPSGRVTGYPGFTETLDTSIRGTLSDETVMRVRSPEPAFWRGQTFTRFDGRTWHVDDDTGTQREGPLIGVPPTLGDAPASPVESRQLIQTFYVEQDLPNIVFAAYRPSELIVDGSVWTRPDGALRADVTLNAGTIYTVLSERLMVDAEVLRSQGDLAGFFAGFAEATGETSFERFLQLPDTTTRRTVELAEQLRVEGEPTFDTIQRYQDWLAANVEYDLDAPVPDVGEDAVDDFLFDTRRGFCEQIASALTVMLRSQGVPARLVTGYVAGERDRVSGVWNVRGSDAHAWVEVWFPQTGWEAFDPTASVPLAGDAGRATVGGDVARAATSWLSAHRVELAAVVVAAAGAWGIVIAVGRLRHRRRRGCWGTLQDRFDALGPSAPMTNPARARAIGTAPPRAIGTGIDGDHEATGDDAVDRGSQVAADLAALLDRAAFDPTWTDDTATYERARAAVAALERSRRPHRGGSSA